MSDEPRNIAYITSRYPIVSHTFVQREILGLRGVGFGVETFTVRETHPSHHRTDVDRQEAQQTVAIVTRSPRRLFKYLIWPALRNIQAVARGFRVSAHGHWGDPRQLLWRLFYTAEAVILWQECSRRKVRHIHAHHADVASNLAQLAAFIGEFVDGPEAGWRWSFTLHGPTELMGVSEHDLASKASSAQFVACISDFTRSQLMLHSTPDNWDRFHIAHCGIDPNRFVPPNNTAVPANGGVDKPFTVLSVGRISAQKGFPILVDAMAQLTSKSSRPVRLIAAGEGPERHELQARANELGVDAQFIGAVGQDEILDLYHQADAFCLPSFMEGLPVVLMEAMSCEVPVVTTDIAGIGELVVHEQTGLLARPGRADMAADQLLRLVEDADLCQRLGRAGRQAVAAEFDINQTVDIMATLFGQSRS